MKKILLYSFILFSSYVFGQNIGINQNSPTNSLHISPINIGDDPLRIDNMQSYIAGDTTLMIIDNTTGIVRYVAKSDLGGMLGDILFQNSTFTDSLNTYVSNNSTGGSDTDIDSARVVGNTLQIFENGTMVTADLTNVTGTSYTAGSGIGISTGNVISNTAPDQTVSITGTGGATVTGTYPNFSIATPTNQTLGSNATQITLTNGGNVPFSTINANDWHTNGNTGTNPSTNFLGTTNNVDMVLRTNNLERMRISSGGAVMTGTTTASARFTSANAGTATAIVGVSTGGTGIIGEGNGAMAGGVTGANTDAAGTGIVGAGNNTTPIVFVGGTGGAFTGNDGSYSKGESTTGTGVIGLGNNVPIANTLTSGSGGAFTGNDGVYGKSVDVTSGTGIIGVGNNIITFTSFTGGGGGAFTGTQNGIIGSATNTSGTSIGVLGIGSQWGLFANGNSGASGTKSFMIDHPLDPANKLLKHYSMESPEVLNFYRGNIILDNNGNGIVQLPNYFKAININYSYTLTPIGAQANTYILEEVNERGQFKISGGNANQKVSWSIYAERNDPSVNLNDFSKAVELNKPQNKIGKYLNPKAYGKTQKDSYFGKLNNRNKETKSIEAPINNSLPKDIE